MEPPRSPRAAARPSLGGSPEAASFEDDARRRLNRNRRLATGLLFAMVAVLAATHMVPDPGFAVRLVRASAEAGIVGGIADWFAVTALFRYPLGIRIPHTAIIPNSKDRIGRALGRFVERHFLTEEVLLAKLRKARGGERISAWLSAPETAPLIAETFVLAVPHLIRALGSQDVHDFASRTLGEQLRQADIAPIVGRAIEMTTASGEADVLFERAVAVAVHWLEDNRGEVDRLVSERSRWWIPKAIDHRIASAIVSGVADLLQDLARPDSDVRLKFRSALTSLIDDLLNSPEQRDQLNASKNRILDHPDVQAWIGSVWSELSDVMLADLAQPSSRMRRALEQWVHLIGRTLAADQAMQRHIDEALERLAIYFISWRGELGTFMAEVVRNWDTQTLTDRLELAVGSDLQYIRMNGTIVGACVGCLMFLVSSLFTA